MNLRSIIGIYVGAFALAIVASCSKHAVTESVGVGPTPRSAQQLTPEDAAQITAPSEGTASGTTTTR